MTDKKIIHDEVVYNGFVYVLAVREINWRNDIGEKEHKYVGTARAVEPDGHRPEYPRWMETRVEVETDAVASFTPDDVAEEVLEELKLTWERCNRRRLSERDVAVPDEPNFNE